jgi:predicted Zn-dependent protease
MIDFFASLEKFGDLSGKSALPGFLSTHPLTGERIKNVKGMLAPEDEQLLLRKNEYLAKIDNIIYGDDPRQGYTEGNAFYHPVMRFAFSYPADWKIQNTPRQVTLVSKDENAAVILQAEKSGEDLQSYARKKAAATEGAVLRGEQSGFIHGFSCFHQLFDVPQEQNETIRIRNSHIRKGEYIYTFSALSTALNFRNYEGSFSGIVGSFTELSDRAHLDRQPLHLRIIRARGGQTLQEIFQSASVPNDLWPKLAIMNGMELAAVPGPNQFVKVVK